MTILCFSNIFKINKVKRHTSESLKLVILLVISDCSNHFSLRDPDIFCGFQEATNVFQILIKVVMIFLFDFSGKV